MNPLLETTLISIYTVSQKKTLRDNLLLFPTVKEFSKSVNEVIAKSFTPLFF